MRYDTPRAYDVRKDDVDYGTVEVVTYYSTTTERQREVTVLLPANYEAKKSYPVLYLFHGVGQDNTHWIRGNAHIVLGNMVAQRQAEEMIVVMPNCRARANDAGNPQDEFSEDNYQAFNRFIYDLQDNLMPFIESHYSIKKGRENTAVAGLSMGGRTALYIGLSMQETFGYIGAFCPAPGIFGYHRYGVSEDGLFQKENFKLLPEYRDNTLVMIVAGDDDDIVVGHPRSYHEVLVRNHMPHVWYSTPGGHDFPVWNHGLYNFVKHIFKEQDYEG